MLHDLDDCTGCYRLRGGMPRDVALSLTTRTGCAPIRRTPFLVDGKLRNYHVVAPVLDKCAPVLRRGSTRPLCVSGCPGKALMVGPLEIIIDEAEGTALQHLYGLAG